MDVLKASFNDGKQQFMMRRNILSVRSLSALVAIIFLGILWLSVNQSFDKSSSQITFHKVLDQVDLRLIVIVYDRTDSLKKCLETLNAAEYLFDIVHIDIWLDRSVSGTIHEPTYIAARDFIFKYGTSKVHNQTKHVGIYGQWIGTWNPKKDSKEIAVIIEDDVNLSPYFYRYLKSAHKKYQQYDVINGFALQGVSIKHGGERGALVAPAGNTVFLYPILGTWGFSPKANNWIRFVEWFKKQSSDENFIPKVPNILPSVWYEQGRQKPGNINPKIWSMWHISFAYLHNELTLYKNSPDKKAFSINRKEKGLHYEASNSKLDPIVTVWNDSYINFPDQPIILDINGHVAIDVQSAWKHHKSRR